MTNKATQRSVINLKLCGVALLSLFIFTQCARNDDELLRRELYEQDQQGQGGLPPQYQQQRSYQQQSPYPPQYQQQYPSPYQQQQYQPYQSQLPPQYQQQQYAPNSRAYANPYDFAPQPGRAFPADNDQEYKLPTEYIMR